jgi:hypothetical protein
MLRVIINNYGKKTGIEGTTKICCCTTYANRMNGKKHGLWH